MLLTKCFSSDQESLTGHAIDLKLNRDIDIKKQSIHNKFSDKAVYFLKALLSVQLSKKFTVPSKFLDMFASVIIHDSTRFGLPESFTEHYSGYGGRGAPAGGKIQFAYDLKSHQVCHATLGSSSSNDLTDCKGNEWITEGSLVLRDLGYYSHEGFKEIMNKGAFFISKAKPKTALFDIHGKRIDLPKLLRRMKKRGLKAVEMDLTVGLEGSFRARVIITLVPEEVKNKRLKAVAYKANNRNYTVQKEYKAWAGINVFVTNVSNEWLTSEKVMDIYRLRWQVELVFKTWKSHYKIDRYKTMRKERMECYLFATLLLVTLQWKIFSWLNHNSMKRGLPLSLHKFTMLMVRLKSTFNEAIVRSKVKMEILLEHLKSFSDTYLAKESKYRKKSFIDIISMPQC